MSGWYVINSSVSIENRLTVYGTANLILCDGVKLYLYNGINVSYGNTLNIYCQSGGSGELYCDADINDNAAIGSNDEDQDCGMITIHGGTVNATGGEYGAGIGSGTARKSGVVTIYGGEVTATGGKGAAGIGGGEGGSGGDVTIYGGTVTATGGEGAMGIGRGEVGTDDGSLTIGEHVNLYGDDIENPSSTISTSSRYRYMATKFSYPYVFHTTMLCMVDRTYGYKAGLRYAIIRLFKDNKEVGSTKLESPNYYENNFTVYTTDYADSMRLDICSEFGSYSYFDDTIIVQDQIERDLTTSGSIYKSEFDNYDIHFDYTVNNLLTPLYVEPNTKSGLTYTGEEQELIDDKGIVLKGGTMQYDIGQDNTSAPSDGWSDSIIPTAADAGNHYVWLRVTSVRGISEEAPKCLPAVTIENASMSSVSVTPTGALTVTDQGLVPHVTTAATTVNNQPVTFTYSKTQNGEYGAMPAFSDFNNNVTVYYKASAPNHDDYFGSFIVPKMQEQTITVEDVALDLGEAGSVSATSNAGGTISYAVKAGSENYIAIDANTGALTLKKYPADGKAYVTVTAAAVGDYVTTAKDMTVTVNLVIKSSLGWDQLIREVAGGNSFAGKTITLANDISVTTMVGSDKNRTFNGTFDGDGHTITFTYNTNYEYVAPFRYVNGATFKNLKVTGTITTSDQYAAGFVANSSGTTQFESCWSNIAIVSTVNGKGVHAGFVGESGVIKFTDCLFDGSISGSNTHSCCGFLGWGGTENIIYVTNCLNLGTFSTKRDHCNTFANYYGYGYLHDSNSYYRNAYGYSQGTQTNATGNELKALLGDGWVIYGSKAVLKCFTITPCYTVTWKNDNGTVIDTTEVEEGTVPTHADPTKTADENYIYTFSGWTPEVVAVTGDAAYTATFTASTRFYDVIIVDTENGTVTAAPAPAAKNTQVTITAEPDANYVLSTIEAYEEYVDNRRVPLTALNGSGNTGNEGYDKLVDGKTDTKWCLGADSGYIIVKAPKAFALNEYSLTTANDTKNYSGRNWKSWEIYGANFTSDSDAVENSNAWQLVTSVTDDDKLEGVNFTQYDYIVSGTPAEYQYYMVKLLSTKNSGISQMSELTLRYPISSYNISLTQDSTDPTKYTFDMPAGNVTINAEFVPGGTITWKNDNGTVIDTTEVKAGDVPTHADPAKADDAHYTYTFAGWTPEVVAVTGDAEYTATFTAEPKSVASVSGYSISLEGDIGINFYTELPNAIANSTTAKMHFTIPTGTGSTNQDVDVKNARIVKSGNKTYYVFKCQVAAKEMTSEIKAQIIDGNPVSDEFTYSVKEYADYLLTHANENGTDEQKAYAKAAPLVKAMLNYGAYSQLYFDKNTDNLANADLTDEEKTLGDITINISAPVFNSLSDGTTFEGATLSLKSETTLSLYFKSSGTLAFACDGYDVETATSGDYQIARIRGIKAKHIGDTFTLKVNGTDAVTYSPLNYCKNVIEDDTQNENLKNVAKALYLYWQAAKNYFD